MTYLPFFIDIAGIAIIAFWIHTYKTTRLPDVPSEDVAKYFRRLAYHHEKYNNIS